MTSTLSGQGLSFGATLKRYRRTAGLSQEELAVRAGYSLGYISKLERSARVPTSTTVELLANALALDPADRAALQRIWRDAADSQRLGFLHPSELGWQHPPLPPLINRAREVAHLERHLTGQSRPVLLFAGGPGIGKTRLLQDAAEQGRYMGWSVLESGHHQHSREGFFAPVLGALESYVHDQPPARLRRWLEGCTWLVRLLPELADTAGVPMPSWTLPAKQERRLLFAAVERFLTNVAGPAGTLLVLDDLQWADADGVDLLGALAYTTGERPLRIVGAYRTTEVGPQERLASLLADLARNRLVERVVLGPLAPEAAAELLDGLMEGFPDGTPGRLGTSGASGRLDLKAWREGVLREAGGVPFYAVCLAEARQSGALDGGPLDSMPAGSGVPWDVAETIRQRVAILPECAQQVIQIAAVAGQRPSRALLVRVARQLGCEEAKALTGLDVACQAHLLVVEGEDAYAFSQRLIQEVVVGDLGPAQRTQLHREVARALESAVGAHSCVPLLAELATQYTSAGDSEKSLPSLQLVAARAEAAHANAAAAASYRALAEGLEALGRSAEATIAREHLSTALGQIGQYDAALETLEQVVEAYRRVGDCEGEGRAVALIGWVHTFRGTVEEGIVRLQRELLGALQFSPGGSAALYVGLAQLFYLRGRYSDARDAAAHAAERARLAEERWLLALAELERGAALDLLGHVAESLEALEGTAIPLLRTQSGPWQLAHALTLAGDVHLVRGDFDAAVRYAEEALAVAQRVDDVELAAYMAFRRARIAYCVGDWDRALADTERAAHAVRRGRPTWWTPTILIGLGDLRLREGQMEQASRDIAEGLALGERSGQLEAPRWARGLQAERDLMEGRAEEARERLEPVLDRPDQQERTVTWLLPLLAQAYLELGDSDRAQVVAAGGVARAEAAGLRLLMPDALRVQALVALRQGRWQDAVDALERALAVSRAIHSPYAEARALYVYGVMHQQKGEPERARGRLAAALSMLNRLGERFYAAHVKWALLKVECPGDAGRGMDDQ